MDEPEQKGFLDRVVELAAGALDALGLNGNRLRWKWRQRRLRLSESRAQASTFLRSARGRHKMCPSCRALVPRSSRTCPECNAGLAQVRAPGIRRLVANVLPGATAATSILLLVNGLLFLLMLVGSIAGERSVGLLSSFSPDVTVRHGSAHTVMVFLDGEWWRLATAIFLHGGLLHFGFNSYVLLSLGPIVEAEYGTERFWVIYLCTGFIGNLTHVFASGGGVVGASGAICGLVGLLIAYGTRVRTRSAKNLKAAMLRFSMLILLISILPGVSWQAHLGGFVSGFLLGWIVPTGRFRSRQTETLWQILSLGAVLLVLYCFYQVALHGTDAFKYFR